MNPEKWEEFKELLKRAEWYEDGMLVSVIIRSQNEVRSFTIRTYWTKSNMDYVCGYVQGMLECFTGEDWSVMAYNTDISCVIKV